MAASAPSIKRGLFDMCLLSLPKTIYYSKILHGVMSLLFFADVIKLQIFETKRSKARGICLIHFTSEKKITKYVFRERERERNERRLSATMCPVRSVLMAVPRKERDSVR